MVKLTPKQIKTISDGIRIEYKLSPWMEALRLRGIVTQDNGSERLPTAEEIFLYFNSLPVKERRELWKIGLDDVDDGFSQYGSGPTPIWPRES
ncbi:MAG: hypothetical protein CL843_19595 [Crocinitomicaceae bacterium]|nr:hypothetical protein [Crocinitomicaceae bacterium]